MKRRKNYPNVSNWHLYSVEEAKQAIDVAIKKGIAEAIDKAFNDEAYFYFPAIFGDTDGIGGEKIEDPLTLYFTIGLDTDAVKTPVYEFNLREDMLMDVINECSSDPSYPKSLRRISTALHELADEIDNAIEKSNLIHREQS